MRLIGLAVVLTVELDAIISLELLRRKLGDLDDLSPRPI